VYTKGMRACGRVRRGWREGGRERERERERERGRDALQIDGGSIYVPGHPRTLRRGENLDQRGDSPSAIDFADARNHQPTSKLVRNAFTCVLVALFRRATRGICPIGFIVAFPTREDI